MIVFGAVEDTRDSETVVGAAVADVVDVAADGGEVGVVVVGVTSDLTTFSWLGCFLFAGFDFKVHSFAIN